MTKECLVTLNNELVTVVLFDGKYVQLPAINKDVAKVNVCYENGKYFIVENESKIKNTAHTQKKKGSQKNISVKTDAVFKAETDGE